MIVIGFLLLSVVSFSVFFGKILTYAILYKYLWIIFSLQN